MIDKVYADKFNTKDLEVSHTGDAVKITTTSGKVIILDARAYVLGNDGMMIQVSELKPGTPLSNVGRVKGMAMVGNRHMMHNKSHRKLQKVNGFVCALWVRKVRDEQ